MGDGSACVPNIGGRERRKRLVFGVTALGAGIVLTVLLVRSDAGLLGRLTVFVPFWGAALGFLQYREKT